MQVRAFNLDNIGTNATPLPSATTLDNPPAPPGAAGLTNETTSQMQANWTANGNPNGTLYTAILSIAPSPSTNGLNTNITLTTIGTSVLFLGLSPDTVYYVEVKATNSNGSSAHIARLLADTRQSPDGRQSHEYRRRPNHGELGRER